MIHSLSLTSDPSLVKRAGSLLCDKCLYLEDQLEEKSVRIVHQIHGNTEKCHIKKSRAEVCGELYMSWFWLEAPVSRRWCVRYFPIFRTLVPADDSGTRITLLQITSSSQCFWRYLHGTGYTWMCKPCKSVNTSVIFRWWMLLRPVIHSQLRPEEVSSVCAIHIVDGYIKEKSLQKKGFLNRKICRNRFLECIEKANNIFTGLKKGLTINACT